MRILKAMVMVSALIVASAGMATAARKQGLPIGGNTIAGPGSAVAALGEVVVVVDGLKEDVCVTVANAPNRNPADVLVEVIENGGDSISDTFGAGETAAICLKNADTVQVTCQGEGGCAFDWRVDGR